MCKLQIILFTAILVFSFIFKNQIGAQDVEVKALLEKTKTKGGLCLVIGAKDISQAEALIKESSLYVQVLQAEAKLASTWGLAIVDSANRENIGVRNADFVAAHYGTNLFNLIFVEDASALGQAKIADLYRILVPEGSVLFKSLPTGFAEEAKSLEMKNQVIGKYIGVFSKPLKPVEWQVCDSLKWRVGSRGRGEFADIVLKDGLVEYSDRYENQGDLAVPDGRKIVRDAYNGRLIKSEKLGEPKPVWYAPSVAKAVWLNKQAPKMEWVERGTGEGFLSKKTATDNKLDLPYFGGHCYKPTQLGKFVLYHHNIWVNTETNERTYPLFVHPYCQFGHVPGNGMIYNWPGSKPNVLAGITALAPTDIPFNQEVGGKILKNFGQLPPKEVEAPTDWPMFRGNPGRGNSGLATPGEKPVKAWEINLGVGEKEYGLMSGERTGLTQAVSAYGLAVVADISSQRIVAVDVKDGKTRWVYHVGSRVDFPPTLYNGLCLFAAKDGWVYCLDAKRGELIWKLLIAPQERFIGGQEKLESLWPTRSDVLVINGVGYACAGFGFAIQGGVRGVAFKPESGEVIWSKCYFTEIKNDGQGAGIADIYSWFTWNGRGILKMGFNNIDVTTGVENKDKRNALCGHLAFDEYQGVGNGLSRVMEDLSGYVMRDNNVGGRALAYDKDLSVAFTVGWGGVSWETFNQKKEPSKLNIYAAKDPKAPLWKSPDIELVADDLVLTPQHLYVVGHYSRIKKDSEIWVMSREDGKILNTIPVNGYPTYFGMSAAGENLFVSTREGKLICYRKKD